MSDTSLAQSIYIISKKAKKIRDLNQKVWDLIQLEKNKLSKFESSYLDKFHKFYNRDEEIISDDVNFNKRKKYAKNKIKTQELKIQKIKKEHRNNELKINKLYRLKTKSVIKLIEEKKAKILGKHKFVAREYALIEFKGFTFHLTINVACKFWYKMETSKSLGELNNITSEIKENITISFEESFKVLENFTKNYCYTV